MNREEIQRKIASINNGLRRGKKLINRWKAKLEELKREKEWLKIELLRHQLNSVKPREEQ